MFSFNSKKLFLIPSLLILNFVSIAQYSNAPPQFIFKYPPLKQPDDQELIKKRRSLSRGPGISRSMSRYIQIFPNTEITNQHYLQGVCYDYALAQTLRLSEEQFTQLQLQLEEHKLGWNNVITASYNIFDQLEHCQTNCLVTYTNEHDFTLLHMAVGANNNQCLSKCGLDPNIIKHNIWEIYDFYGNNTYFWQLKQQYCVKNGQEILFNYLQQLILDTYTSKKIS